MENKFERRFRKTKLFGPTPSEAGAQVETLQVLKGLETFLKTVQCKG
jgi:hypothetical protein